MMRFLTLDHAYDAAFAALPHANHEEWFEKAVFGTSDFLDVALRAAGYEAKTLVQNFFMTPGWPGASMMASAQDLEPDVVLSREAVRFPASMLRPHFPHAKLVCTCSHRVEDSALKGFDCIFTSFPWFVEHVRGLGIRCEYLPLAFGKPVLDRVKYDGPRDIPVSFIGGLGTRTWKAGTEAMAKIAEAIPEFVWHGYCQGSLSDMPPSLQKAYRGEAFGADMYRLLMRTKIALNRHGEIARGFGQNCRAYEAPGVGCWYLSDCDGEFQCATYGSPEAAISTIGYMLERDEQREREAKERQAMVLKFHAFEARTPRFLEVVEKL